MPASPTGVPLNERVRQPVPGDGVVHDAVGRAGHRVHAHEEGRVAALLEELRVLRPLVLDDEIAARIEQVGNQRVERPAAAGAVAVHDDDLGRAAVERAAHRGVDLLGVEAGAVGVERVPPVVSSHFVTPATPSMSLMMKTRTRGGYQRRRPPGATLYASAAHAHENRSPDAPPDYESHVDPGARRQDHRRVRRRCEHADRRRQHRAYARARGLEGALPDAGVRRVHARAQGLAAHRARGRLHGRDRPARRS